MDLTRSFSSPEERAVDGLVSDLCRCRTLLRPGFTGVLFSDESLGPLIILPCWWAKHLKRTPKKDPKSTSDNSVVSPTSFLFF